MDHSRDERHIEDYLFSSYNGGTDQEFARPIEDEDLFAPTANNEAIVQSKKMTMKEMLRQQALAMPSLKPNKLGSGLESGDTIQVGEAQKMVSNKNPKFNFEKLFNKSKKGPDSGCTPEKQLSEASKWESYKSSLRKRICAEKRKIWDSFQQPVDEFDDEEEYVEEEKPDEDGEEEAADAEEEEEEDDEHDDVEGEKDDEEGEGHDKKQEQDDEEEPDPFNLEDEEW